LNHSSRWNRRVRAYRTRTRHGISRKTLRASRHPLSRHGPPAHRTAPPPASTVLATRHKRTMRGHGSPPAPPLRLRHPLGNLELEMAESPVRQESSTPRVNDPARRRSEPALARSGARWQRPALTTSASGADPVPIITASAVLTGTDLAAHALAPPRHEHDRVVTMDVERQCLPSVASTEPQRVVDRPSLDAAGALRLELLAHAPQRTALPGSRPRAPGNAETPPAAGVSAWIRWWA
jgi:hypothetical protein